MISASDVRNALAADLVSVRDGAAESFSAIINDSRVTKPGELFVALRTPDPTTPLDQVRDGHDYVANAVANGAAGVIVSRDVEVPPHVAVYTVSNTKHALGELGRWWRSRFFVKTTVVTGNTGKTTTKELTAALLARKYNVLKSPMNFNDEIGLSMTIFGLNETHECAVFEVGMFELGEIARLCEVAQPDTSVVLNVGPTHLERLGSLENIARAKGEAVEALGPGGTAVLNADDPYVAAMASKTRGRVLTFGITNHADVRATEIRSKGLGGVDFTLHAAGRALQAHSPLPGQGLVYNALAAIAVAFNDAMSIEEAVFGLSQVTVPTRLQARAAANGATILDDSYNASPASMLAALGVLSETMGRRLALLGDMLELGSAEAEGHRQVGERAAQVVDLLFTVGSRGAMIAAAARAAGATNVIHFETKEAATSTLRELLQPGDVLLVKASHGLALDRVVQALIDAAQVESQAGTRGGE